MEALCENLRGGTPMTLSSGIHIEPYSAQWPIEFAAERARLATVLAPWLAGPIEHVGSTAVPGLAAKPVIDIMAAVESLEASRPALQAVAPLGYLYAPYRADQMHWFCKPSPEIRTHHLHLVPFRSARWNDCIRFRDLLIAHPRLAGQYAALKRRLAHEYPNDREAYTRNKAPFIEHVLHAEH
jgi:GrpB-like predicted nucleotidyltransferase (UPF0157 family)